MPPRRVAVGLVTVLLVAAGCSALPTGDPAGGPAAPGGDATSLADADYPPGFSRTDVTMSAARNRTLALLRIEPVEVVARERFRPGAYVDYRFAANATHARFRLDVHNGDADVTRRDTYVTPTARYVRDGRNGRVSYTTSNATVAVTRRRSAGSLWAVVSRMLVLGDYRAVGVDDDPRQRIRYELAGTIVEDAGDQRGCLVVDADGVISRAVLAYTVGGERKRFEYAVRRRAGVTVDRPAWLSGAAGGASNASRAEQPGGTVTDCVDGADGTGV